MAHFSDDIDGIMALKLLRTQVSSLVEQIGSDKKWGFDKNWEDFMSGMSFLNPQSYGFRIENRLRNQLDAIRNSVNTNNGDFKDQKGVNYECKTSVLLKSDSKVNLVQIRPWQNADYYCVFFDMRNNGFTPYCFKLTAEEMKEELSLTGATPAHGTYSANRANKNIEYRFSFGINSDDKVFNRWLEKYLIEFDFTHKINLLELLEKERKEKLETAKINKLKNESKFKKASESIKMRREAKEKNKKSMI